MAKQTKCKNCGLENPYYQLKCKDCHSYIRRRVVNIELWENIGKVIESPSKAFENIIFAEHKNFLILMGVLFSLSILADLNLVSNIINEVSLISTAFISFGIILGSSLLNALILKFTFLFLGSRTRILDNFYLTIFASVPQIFSFIILFPVQLALFGEYWFTFNPSPIAFKETQSFILLGLEGVLFLWSLVLLFFAFKVQTDNYIQAFLGMFVSFFMIYILPIIILQSFFLTM